MKRCPACNRDYPDDFQFCLDDASILEACGTLSAPGTAMTREGFAISEVSSWHRMPQWGLGIALPCLLIAGFLVSRPRVPSSNSTLLPALPPTAVSTPTASGYLPDNVLNQLLDQDKPASDGVGGEPLPVNLLANLLSQRRTFMGEAEDSRRHKRWPFRLTPTEYTASSGRLMGELEWTTLGSTHRIDGRLTNGTLTFQETGYIHRGKAVLGPQYSLSENSDRKLIGKWEDANRGTGGTVWCGEAEPGAAPVSSPIGSVKVPTDRLLRGEDLAGKSDWELILMRNEPYARHGYRFHNTKIRAYFMQQEWYKPFTGDMDTVTRQLSDTEKQNIQFIIGY